MISFLKSKGFKNFIVDTDALMSNKPPVILLDVADNIGEGTSGDGTELLRELLKKNADGAVLKEVIAWKTGINIKTGEIIYVDTPGLCNADLSSFNYKNINGPVYPLDDFELDLKKLITVF
ncbi:MAG: hypothetical protein M1475_00235 [Actinobacteria bacterium]|nr:hypothetical protein [Actinomycetota bacterium]